MAFFVFHYIIMVFNLPYPVLLHIPTLHHDILRFEVKVNDASLVYKVQGFDDLSHKLDADFFI